MKKKPTKKRKRTKTIKPELGDSVTVEWIDAVARNTWQTHKNPMPCAKCVSSGYLVAIEKDRITMCSDVDVSNGNISRLQSIPKGCIEKINVKEKKQLEPFFHLTPDKDAK